MPWNLVISVFCAFGLISQITHAHSFASNDMSALKNQVETMFYHAYDGYMKHAFPFDELRPLTCDGHDTWGSFSLTLVDALDTLAIMGNWSEFRRASQLLIDHLDINRDVNVSVFETNIRVVGGLISAHLLSRRAGFRVEQDWPCSGPLLHQAVLFARKLLPAFDTPTGMPYGTVNLAMTAVPPNETTVSCVATVGTLILEFGTLSRLTGDPQFEAVALRALRALWQYRSSIGLLGNHIDVKTGTWVAQEATIGGAVDSFFEYLVKGAALFRLPELDFMFREYKRAIDQYLKYGDWHVLTNMGTGHVTQPLFQGLDAYWPGVLTLTGDLDGAIRHVTAYHEVWKQYGFIPEAYNVITRETNSRGNSYHLRPEFIESVYYLYRATKDPVFLQMGRDVLTSIEQIARTSCGYATILDVTTHTLTNRMESFFLAETTKYLYLLFDEDNFVNALPGDHFDSSASDDQCQPDSGGYIFNTEAHLINPGALACCSRVEHDASVLPQPHDPRSRAAMFLDIEALKQREHQFDPTEQLLELVENAFEQTLPDTDHRLGDTCLVQDEPMSDLADLKQVLRMAVLEAMALHWTIDRPLNFTVNSSLVELDTIEPTLLTCPGPSFHQRYTFAKELVLLV